MPKGHKKSECIDPGLEPRSSNLKRKGANDILKINKEQAEFIRKHAKESRITITGRGKKSRGKRWYVDESYESLDLLKQFEVIHQKI